MIERVSYTHLRCLECNQWVNKSFKARTWSEKVTLTALPEVGQRCHMAHRASPGWPSREKTLSSETPLFSFGMLWKKLCVASRVLLFYGGFDFPQRCVPRFYYGNQRENTMCLKIV